jgi:hypothetical protein
VTADNPTSIKLDIAAIRYQMGLASAELDKGDMDAAAYRLGVAIELARVRARLDHDRR